MANRYNIVVPRKYEHNGDEKTAWGQGGTLVHFPATGDKPDGFIIELNMHPDTTFKVFPQENKKKVESSEDKW
mgnify:FL=1